MQEVQTVKPEGSSTTHKLNENINFRIDGEMNSEFSNILTFDALMFISQLHRKFFKGRDDLLDRRNSQQEKIDSGTFPCFPEESLAMRGQKWAVSDIPQDLIDRRVEITGPVDRKMIINALNSGAQVYMADFEDSHSPTWKGTIHGQINIYDAVRRKIQLSNSNGKEYRLKEQVAVLFIRPRGWHLVEKHVQFDGRPASASLFDFGLFFFHNAAELIRQGKRPYFYLPKIENHLEARLWNDVFIFSQDYLGIPRGTIRATVLIETILAAFEMDEILYELKDHSAGLNCGRWDYIFSFIKKFRNHSRLVLPDRDLVTMNAHFLKSYCQLLIKTCHHRKIHAMGGMAAQIPIKDDPIKNAQAMERVTADKRREVSLGHDGTWVAHPALVEIAGSIFKEGIDGPNQLHVSRDSWDIQPVDLLKVPEGEITEAGLRNNVNIALLYLESWLRGNGCVPLYNLMEDAATAEISRAQIWQWIHHGRFKEDEFLGMVSEELRKYQVNLGRQEYQSRKFELASDILVKISISKEFTEFLTVPAYAYL